MGAPGQPQRAEKLRVIPEPSRAIVSSLNSALPVTESEIQLVLGCLGADIATLFAEDA